MSSHFLNGGTPTEMASSSSSSSSTPAWLCCWCCTGVEDPVDSPPPSYRDALLESSKKCISVHLFHTHTRYLTTFVVFGSHRRRSPEVNRFVKASAAKIHRRLNRWSYHNGPVVTRAQLDAFLGDDGEMTLLNDALLPYRHVATLRTVACRRTGTRVFLDVFTADLPLGPPHALNPEGAETHPPFGSEERDPRPARHGRGLGVVPL